MKTRAVLLAMLVVLFAGASADATYMSYISGTSPVGWWGMNETGAPAATADLSGPYGALNNHQPTYPDVNLPETYQNAGVNTLPDQAGWVSGPGNRSTYFDGTAASNAYAHATGPYSSALGGAIYRYESGFSVEVWAKLDGYVVTDSERFLGVREWGLGFQAGPTGMLHFTTFGKQDYFGNQMPSDGLWHQIGLSWDGSTASFFIDGAAAGSQAGAAGLTGINNLSINNQLDLASRASTNTQNFKGWLDEVVIWDHTRSEADFAASYAAGTAPGTVIPEPAGLGLIGIALLALRKRRS